MREGKSHLKDMIPAYDLWASSYRKLLRAWEDGGSFGSPPPIPVKRSGAGNSDDTDRSERWQQTLEWAAAHGVQHLLPKPVARNKSDAEIAEIRARNPQYSDEW
jgi:hypothetical protein